LQKRVSMHTNIPLIVLVGPTASGKTALAIDIAEHLSGEIVGADSRQIYREMEIATAKPTNIERTRIPHHLLDVVAPDESFTLANYQAAAMAAIRDISARGKYPLLVGGTGLYIRSVVDGLSIPAVEPRPELRQEWESFAALSGVEALHALLAARDPEAAARIPAANIRRVIRALEVCEVTGRPFSEQQVTNAPSFAPLIIIGLNTDRAVLYQWADKRVDRMLDEGLLAEVESLVAKGYSWNLPSMSGLGYRQIGAYLRDEMTLSDAVQRLKFDTHGFIRKQLIWFRPDSRIYWIDTAAPDRLDQALKVVESYRLI
jgi:tRNA dimethylallyltransferase